MPAAFRTTYRGTWLPGAARLDCAPTLAYIRTCSSALAAERLDDLPLFPGCGGRPPDPIQLAGSKSIPMTPEVPHEGVSPRRPRVPDPGQVRRHPQGAV